MSIREEVSIMKQESPLLAASSGEVRNRALRLAAEALQAHRAEIFAANAEDMAFAKENGVSAAVQKRLKFDEGKLKDVVDGIDMLIGLPDPLGRVQLDRKLDETSSWYAPPARSA